MKGGLGGQEKKDKGLRGTDWQLKNSQGNVKYSIGNVVNNIVITIYSARWEQDLSG